MNTGFSAELPSLTALFVVPRQYGEHASTPASHHHGAQMGATGLIRGKMNGSISKSHCMTSIHPFSYGDSPGYSEGIAGRITGLATGAAGALAGLPGRISPVPPSSGEGASPGIRPPMGGVSGRRSGCKCGGGPYSCSGGYAGITGAAGAVDAGGICCSICCGICCGIC